MTYLGNISFLDQSKHGFLCSRCTKSSVILPCLDWAVERAHGDEVVMSTFHSEMEEAVLDVLIGGKCPIIIVLGRSLYKTIPEKLQQLLNSNRLLIISLCDQKRITKESALLCNKFICEQSNEITFGYLSRDSSLFPLYENVIGQNKSVKIIDGYGNP